MIFEWIAMLKMSKGHTPVLHCKALLKVSSTVPGTLKDWCTKAASRGVGSLFILVDKWFLSWSH